MNEEFPKQVSDVPTPWAVICDGPWDKGDRPELQGCGTVYLTEAGYENQLSMVDRTWRCPICCCEADWDDDNYEKYITKE